MVKGIINAFDHMKVCLVRNLTTTGLAGIRTVFVHRILYVSIATSFYTR